MKHLCKNFLEKDISKCGKCRTPEWAVFFPEVIHKIGSKVRLPLNYTNGGEVFFVLKKDKNGYTIGKTKDEPICWFDWWELYPVKKVIL